MTLKSMESPAEKGAPWCAVYTRHQHERSIGEMLEAKGFEVFLPLYESTRRWKDRRKVLSLPLFPCYIFLRGAHERRLPVLSTPGVHMIISRGERVETIPEEEIEAIRRIVAGPLHRGTSSVSSLRRTCSSDPRISRGCRGHSNAEEEFVQVGSFSGYVGPVCVGGDRCNGRCPCGSENDERSTTR